MLVAGVVGGLPPQTGALCTRRGAGRECPSLQESDLDPCLEFRVYLLGFKA